MKLRRKLISLCAAIMALSMLAACGGGAGTNETPDAGPEPTPEPTASELVVAGSEIACGVDPTVYPAADYLLNMGAAEILFKVDADGIQKLSLTANFT